MMIGMMAASALAAGTPVTIGSSAGTGADLGSSYNCLVNRINVASATGTLTKVTSRITVTGSKQVVFFTMSPSRIVRDISANLTAVTGLTDYTVSLAVTSGDFIGWWCPTADQPSLVMNTASVADLNSIYYGVVGTKPTIGTDLTSPLTGYNGLQISALGVS